MLKGAWGEMGEGLRATEGKKTARAGAQHRGRTGCAMVCGQGSRSLGLPRSPSSPDTESSPGPTTPCPQHPGKTSLPSRRDRSCKHRRCRVLAWLLRVHDTHLRDLSVQVLGNKAFTWDGSSLLPLQALSSRPMAPAHPRSTTAPAQSSPATASRPTPGDHPTAPSDHRIES